MKLLRMKGEQLIHVTAYLSKSIECPTQRLKLKANLEFG